MSVETTPIRIDPYQSTVPLVPLQVPEGDTVPKNSQAPPAFKGNATGIATIGDSLLRGFMQGHAQKEQRKNAQAMAEYQAGSASLNAARQTYQQAIDSGQAKPNDPNDPYFKAYQETSAPILKQLEPLTMPQKQAKGKKGEKSEKGQGIGAKFHDFMAANQHIIPGLAMMALTPTPLGKSQQGEVQNLELQTKNLALKSAQREDAQADQLISDQNVIAAANAAEKNMKPEEKQAARAAMKPEDRKKLEEAEARRDERINEKREEKAGKGRLWYNAETKQFKELPEDQTPDAGSGFAPYEKPSTAGAPKGEEATVISYAQEHNLDPKNIPAEVRKAVHDWYNTKPEQRTETISVPAHLDSNGNWVASSTISMRGAVSGSEPGEPNVPKTQGGITPPPGAAQSPQQVFTRNQAWAKPDWQTQLTKLSPQEEQKFQQWWAQTKAKQPDLTDPDSPTADYDYRGYWKAQQAGDPNAKRGANQHFPDTYKTPYHKTFSKESRYATEGAPSWQGDVLKDSQGNVIADETPKKSSGGIMARPGSTPKTASETPKTTTNGKMDYRSTPPPGRAASGDGVKGGGTWQQTGRNDRLMKDKSTVVEGAMKAFNTAKTKAQNAYTNATFGSKPDYTTAGTAYGGSVWNAVTEYVSNLKAGGLKGQDIKDALDALDLDKDTYQKALKLAGVDDSQQHNVGDVVLVNGKKVKITAIDPKTGKATGELVRE